MSLVREKTRITQLPMPGMPVTVRAEVHASCCKVSPGQEVLYVGTLNGGPPYGAHGVVKMTLLRKAVVDLGPEGTWNVPYHLLGMPNAA